MMKKILKIEYTEPMIQSQVNNDLIAYQRIIKQKISWPIDVEDFIEKLWNVEVIYEDEIQIEGFEDIIVGYFSPKEKIIKISLAENKLTGRLNFSTAHEAGHVSLHSILSASNNNQIKDQVYCRKPETYIKGNADWRLEWEANTYASNLLIPKIILFENLNPNNTVDLDLESDYLTKLFGVSRQMLELKLFKLKFKTKNNKYTFTK